MIQDITLVIRGWDEETVPVTLEIDVTTQEQLAAALKIMNWKRITRIMGFHSFRITRDGWVAKDKPRRSDNPEAYDAELDKELAEYRCLQGRRMREALFSNRIQSKAINA